MESKIGEKCSSFWGAHQKHELLALTTILMKVSPGCLSISLRLPLSSSIVCSYPSSMSIDSMEYFLLGLVSFMALSKADLGIMDDGCEECKQSASCLWFHAILHTFSYRLVGIKKKGREIRICSDGITALFFLSSSRRLRLQRVQLRQLQQLLSDHSLQEKNVL